MSELSNVLPIISGAGDAVNLASHKTVDNLVFPGNISIEYLLLMQLRGKAFSYCDFIDLGSGIKHQILITPPPLITDDPALVFYNVQGAKGGLISFLPNATAVGAGGGISLSNLNGMSTNNPKTTIDTTSGATSSMRMRHGRFGGSKAPGGIILSTGFIPKFGEKLVLEIESEETSNDNIAFEITVFEINGIVDKT